MKRFIKSAIACIAAVAMIATVAPVTTQAAAKKPVVVKTQAQLEKAIKAGATNITIKTDKKVAITIPATKKAAKVAFTVNAPKASVENKANNGKGLEIKNAAAFKESGKNNAITIATKKDITVTVAKASKGAEITVAKANANLTVKANGAVKAVSLEAKGAQVDIKGSSTKSIAITAKAANTSVTTAVPASINVAKGASDVAVAAKADVSVAVAKNATVATLEVQAAGVDVSLNAKGTVADVKVAAGAEGAKLDISASGTVGNVTVDAKADVAVGGTTTDSIKLTVNAEGTSVKAETAVETTLNADAKVDLGAGAEGSKLTTGEGVTADVTNNTEGGVTVTDSTGKETTVDAGKTETKEDPKQPEDEKKDETPSTPSVPSGPTYSDPTYSKPTSMATVSAIRIEPKTGSSVTVAAVAAKGVVTEFRGVGFAQLKEFIESAWSKIKVAPSTSYQDKVIITSGSGISAEITLNWKDYSISNQKITISGKTSAEGSTLHTADVSIISTSADGATYLIKEK